MLKCALAYSVVALISCTSVGTTNHTRFAILPTSQGRAAIDQCSRSAPEHVTHFWSPTSAQVEAAEKALPAFLYAQGHKDWLRNSFRQYVGVVVAGKRLIYLNAFPTPTPGTAEARDAVTKAYIFCDGGSSFWGAEFDPATAGFSTSTPMVLRDASNQSMKPTAPLRNNFNVIATTPCHGLFPSR